MMQPANFRDGYDFSLFRWFDWSRFRTILIQWQVASAFVVIIEIGFQHASKMLFIENDHVIQAVSPDWTDDSFAIGILPRTLKSSFHFFYSHPIDSLSEHFAVDVIVVPYEIFWGNVPWKCLYDLLSCPSFTRVLSYVEMNNSTPFVKKDNKDLQHAEGGCRNCEEVDWCHRLTSFE